MRRLVLKMTCVTVAMVAVILVPYAWGGARMAIWTAGLIANAQAHHWLTGVILGGLLAADVVLPVPSSMVSIGCGYLLGPVWGMLASTVGMSLGCVIGYGVGRQLGSLAVGRFVSADEMKKLENWQSRMGLWMLILSRPIPVMAEASTVFAGMLRFGWGRFMLVTTVANFAISLGYAIAGSLAVGLNLDFLIVSLLTVGILSWLIWAFCKWW